MRIFWQDLRYGARMLLKQPGFTLVAVITIALGVGANSVIFSVVNAVLLRPLGFKEPERLVRIWETLPQGGTGTASVPNLKDWSEQNDVWTQMAGYITPSFNLQNQESPERVSGATVTADFFDVLGVGPHLGRTFRRGEDQPGNHRVVVLSDQLWQRNFSADPTIVGKNISINGENFTIIGVMPPGFRFPSRLTQLWTPLALPADRAGNRGNHFLSVIARSKPGVTLAQAQQQMSGIARRLEEQYPNDQAGRGILLAPLHETIVRDTRPALLVLLSAVGFVLLIACTNVANLLLARATARRREIGIRLALGAGRWRLMRQLLTESLLLSMIGGVLGLSLAKWGVNALVTLAAQVLPRSSEVSLDGRVVGFTLLLSLLTGIVFGLIPAIQSSRVDVQATLKEGGSAGESMILLGLFAALAVILAIVGIYSVMSYTVTQSTREIGIRVALGAQQRDIMTLVVGHGLVLAIAGIGIGVAGALLLTRLMTTLLFGVSATDPLTFSGVSAMLLVVALLACFIPARRAAKVDPITALRHE